MFAKYDVMHRLLNYKKAAYSRQEKLHLTRVAAPDSLLLVDKLCSESHLTSYWSYRNGDSHMDVVRAAT